MKLSIIIPYYRTIELTKALLRSLEPQLTDEVEVIVVDDGCHERELDGFNVRVIHLDENSGTASVPRNVGINESRGEYISFVDADDMVLEDYVEEILKKIPEKWDYFYIGWTSKWGNILIEDEPLFWNTSVWNCVYRRDLIGEERFDADIVVGEDKDFNERVRKGLHSYIPKVLYVYNTDVEGSLTWNKK